MHLELVWLVEVCWEYTGGSGGENCGRLRNSHYWRYSGHPRCFCWCQSRRHEWQAAWRQAGCWVVNGGDHWVISGDSQPRVLSFSSWSRCFCSEAADLAADPAARANSKSPHTTATLCALGSLDIKFRAQVATSCWRCSTPGVYEFAGCADSRE